MKPTTDGQPMCLEVVTAHVTAKTRAPSNLGETRHLPSQKTDARNQRSSSLPSGLTKLRGPKLLSCSQVPKPGISPKAPAKPHQFQPSNKVSNLRTQSITLSVAVHSAKSKSSNAGHSCSQTLHNQQKQAAANAQHEVLYH